MVGCLTPNPHPVDAIQRIAGYPTDGKSHLPVFAGTYKHMNIYQRSYFF
jgi:hypothetical protein